MSTSESIIADLKDEIGRKKSQRQSLLDRLTLLDANIDTNDILIGNIDKEALRLMVFVNDSITAVKQAYEARITAECKSDLAWVKISETQNVPSYGIGRGLLYGAIQVWEVQKDPATYAYEPYHGIKFYQNPLNRDYGSNIIVEFTGSVSIANSFISVTDTKGLSSLIQVGDKITDSLDTPVLFSSADLPSVVGFGTTFAVGITSSLTANISLGSTILAVGYGTLSGITTGMYVQKSGVLSDNTKVVGFGTTSVTSGVNTFTLDTIVLSSSAGIGTTNGIFSVGISSFLPIINITTSPTSNSIDSQFTVIRPGSTDIDKNFDWKSSPFNPIVIGTLTNSTVSTGTSGFYDYSGNPNTKTTWDKSSSYYNPITKTQVNPEPSIGAGRAEYYTGSLTWPVLITATASGGGFPTFTYATTYAPLGTKVQVIVGVGITSQFVNDYANIGPSALSPSRPACTTLDSNITAAIANMNSVKNQYMSTIQSLVNASQSLRAVRDKKELNAWSTLQGSANMREEIAKLEASLESIEKFNFTQFE